MALAAGFHDTIDFSRYAPDRAARAIAPQGELAALWTIFTGGWVLIGQSAYHAGRIILQRAWHWTATNVVQSLKSAWLIGSAGWITSATLFALHVMAG
jgi:hypothetical protein